MADRLHDKRHVDLFVTILRHDGPLDDHRPLCDRVHGHGEFKLEATYEREQEGLHPVMPVQQMGRWKIWMNYVLDERETVPNTSAWTAYEGEQVGPHARDASDVLRRALPTLGSGENI